MACDALSRTSINRRSNRSSAADLAEVIAVAHTVGRERFPSPSDLSHYGDDTMRRRRTLAAAAMVAAGALLGWLVASGRLAQLAHAEEKQGQASAKGGA